MKEKKLLCSVISFFIIFSLAIPVSSTVAFVAPEIEIYDWYDLDAIRDNLGGSYVLMNDLDSTTAGYEELASPEANQGKGWQPIGAWNPYDLLPDHAFTGTFNGQGHEIRDLFISRPDEDSSGLFCYVSSGGVIEDVGAVDADVTGGWLVGGLSAVNEGTVSNSYSTGSVTGAEYSEYVGGLIGGNGGTVSNSYAAATVTGYSYVGGLVGENDGWVRNSSATGSVTGNYYVGGLVGLNYYGNVSNSYATGGVTGDSYVGGLVGRNDGLVSNSYSIGSVAGDEYVGGLVGLNENSVSRSFWDIETSGQAISAGGTGKTTADMKSITTFSDWEITAVAFDETNPSYTWNIVDGETYPFLSWEQPREAPVVQYTLTISSTEGGSVTTPGEGTFKYDAGTEVSLEATPTTGYGFVNWADDVDTIANANLNAATTTITMNGNYKITARFMGVGPVTRVTLTEPGIVNARVEADTEVKVDGPATVTVAPYKDNPGGDPPTDSITMRKYIDVNVSDITDVTEVEIRLYYTDAEVAKADIDEETLRLSWLNGDVWKLCSDSGVNTDSNYIWAKIRATDTTPTLAYLQGQGYDGVGYKSSPPPPQRICFIATSAYGTDTAKEIDILREFRDAVLLPNSLGAEFVSFYYKISPPLANFISQHEVLRTAVRVGFVDPIVKILNWSHDLWSARG